MDNEENLCISESSPNSQINNSRRNNRSNSKSLSVTNNSPMIDFKSHVSYKALKSRRGVIKMLFVVVLIYFISVSPQVLVFILFDTNAIRSVPQFIQTPYFIAFTMLFVTISSASNPIVYAIFCSKFRLSFKKILRRLCFCIRPMCTWHTNQRSVQQRMHHLKGKMISIENNNGQRR
jgi:hypothetical protein